ncbi:hypothetical protein NE237_012258 [Protea cynaroides]|uniref:AAA+ ATPase domain-containing protein n=1 Tax=Protea cynaroides TaxID=273540 RepID=A0A9Q0JYM8_9MAGN|nr:hypothetical protein NE237_012258 [Protea cynaroides]
MEIVIGTITKASQYLISPFMDQVNYLLHYKRNADDVRNQMARLKELKTDIQSSSNVARMRGEVIKVVVEGWIIRVNQLESRETELQKELQKELEESKGCLQGGCSGRYQVGKYAKQMIDQIKELLNESRTFDAVSYPAPLPPSLETIQTQGFQVYDSTKLAMDQIMKALKDEGINMVGVYGIGGVGKTTLMKEVAKKLKNNGVFNQVVMVTMSQDPVWTNIQGEIAENLGLQLTQESLSVRARLLLKRLKEEKRILIVLDDLWKPLNLLEQIGIPYGNNCKVVLTTRQFEVCNQMETQFNVEVKVLSKRDSWVLFKWAAGDQVEDDHTLQPVAEQLVRECEGLPLAIITIGRALRTKDRSEWEDAASQLTKSSSSPPDIEGLSDLRVLSIDKMWGRWTDDQSPLDVSLLGKLKKLEILHVVQCNVENLPKEIGELTNLMSLNLSGNPHLTIPPNTLLRLSLLEELYLEHSFHKWEMEGSEDGSKACLSDVVSLSALSLSRLNIQISNIKCLREISNIQFRWENLLRFSVIFGTIPPYELIRSEFFKCSTRVHIFCCIPPFSDRDRIYLLERTEGLQFKECPGFKNVLTFGARGLNNLRVLSIEQCCDTDEYILSSSTTTFVDEANEKVPQIAFRSLELLNLYDVPKLKAICSSHCPQIFPLQSGGCFNNLRFLQLRKCSGLINIIPSYLLAKLPNLEQLEARDCCGLTETIWYGIVSPLSLLNLEKIIIHYLEEIKFMFSFALAERLQHLKYLEIQSCDEMVQIISMEENTQGISSSTPELNPSSKNNSSSSSSSSVLPTPIFGNLRHLDIGWCNSLKHMLPMSLAQGLLQLEELQIWNCPNLEEIIVNDLDHDRDEEDIEEKQLSMGMCRKTAVFPRLRELALGYLRNLSAVSKGVSLCHYDWPSLERLEVYGCPNLKRLPLNLQTATKLKEIEVDEEWLNGMEWDEESEKDKALHLLHQRGVKVRCLEQSDTIQLFEEKTESYSDADSTFLASQDKACLSVPRYILASEDGMVQLVVD